MERLNRLLSKIGRGIVSIVREEEKEFVGNITEVRQGYDGNPSSPVTLYKVKGEDNQTFRCALYGHIDELHVADRIEIAIDSSHKPILEKKPYAIRRDDGMVETGIERVFWKPIGRYRKLPV